MVAPTPEETEKKFQNGWTNEVEQLMAEWADKAACYRWMHEKTERAFDRYNQYFTIPVIILSTLTGTANFGIGSMVPDAGSQKVAQAIIGGVSLLTGIISTVANFLRYAQGSEANRTAAISWGKFQRLIAIELSLNPDERSDCMHFLKMCRTELDRLIEQSPPIPNDIIAAFKVEFKHYPLVRKPEIAGEILHTNIYDGTNERVVRLAAESALIADTRKGVMKQLVLDDLESRIQGLIETNMKTRKAEPLKPTTVSNGLAARKEELSKVALGGVVSSMRSKLMNLNLMTGPAPPGIGGVILHDDSPIHINVTDVSGSVPGTIEERDEPTGKD